MTTALEQKYLDVALDPTFTNKMARAFDNDEPAPAKHVAYDPSLRNTGVLAYYVNPEEVVDLHPEYNRPLVRSALKQQIGTTDPYMGLNPELQYMDEEFVHSAIKHEQGHGAQPKGKLALKGIRARTSLGNVPLGEMFIEGWDEYTLEKRGEKPPSRYMDESQGSSLYSQYREFVRDVEQSAPGVTRQIMRAAEKAGPEAAMRVIETIPDVNGIITKYAGKLNYRMN